MDIIINIVMRRILTPLLMATFALLIATRPAAGADTLALDVTSDTGVFAGSFTNLGWQFTVNAPILVDGLGVFDVNPAGLVESHQIGLWDNNGTLLAATTVTNGSTLVPSVSNNGDWLFQSIAPVLLLPGTYVTGAFYPSSVNADTAMALATITTVPQISFLHSRGSQEGVFAEPGVFGGAEPGVFGADIRIAAATVPDQESTFALLAAVAAGLMLFCKRHRKFA